MAFIAAAGCGDDLKLASEIAPDAVATPTPVPSTTPDACELSCRGTSRLIAIAAADDASTGSLLELEPQSGARIRTTSLFGGAGRLVGLSWHVGRAQLFAIHRALDVPTLVSIARETGEVREIGAVSVVGAARPRLALVDGMTYDPCTNALYLTAGEERFISDILLRVDPDTAEATVVGTYTGMGDADLLASVAGQMIASDVRTDLTHQQFFAVDTQNAVVSSLGLVPMLESVEALAWDPVSGMSYAVDISDRGLRRIDLVNLTATPVVELYADGEFGNNVAALSVVCD